MRPGGKRERPAGAPLALIRTARSTHAGSVRGRGRGRCPDRLDYSVIGETGARPTLRRRRQRARDPEQQRDYARWQLRALMTTDPGRAGACRVVGRGREAAVHRGQHPRRRARGHDAMLQVIRDLVTLYVTNDVVDDLLDHAIVVVIPTTNPDGRVAGAEREPVRPEPRPARPVPPDPGQHRLQLEWSRRSDCSCTATTTRPLSTASRSRTTRARIRQVPLLEPAAAGRQRGGDRGDRPDHPAAGQPVGLARRQREQERRPGRRRGLGRLGPVLHADLRRLLRRRRLDGRDVQRRGLAAAGIEARAVPRLLLLGRLLGREQECHPRRPAGDLPARRPAPPG